VTFEDWVGVVACLVGLFVLSVLIDKRRLA
jgi:hypothetical protein